MMERIFEGLSPLMPDPNWVLPEDTAAPSPVDFRRIPDLLPVTTDADKSPDALLAYIDRILMEEGAGDDGVDSLPDQHPAVVAAQKPFLEIIGTQSSKPMPDSNGFVNCDGYIDAECELRDNGRSPLVEFPAEVRNSASMVVLPEEPGEENESFAAESGKGDNRVTGTGQKKTHRDRDDSDALEARSAKHSSICTEEEIRDLFDRVLLCTGNNSCDFKAPPPGAVMDQFVLPPGNKRGRKKGQRKQEATTVDLETLLIQCAQAAGIDDCRAANHYLMQIKKHSSPYGSAEQRLAHNFAEGLQARLSGTGDTIYSSLSASRSFTCDLLKAYHLYLTLCPFKKISHFFSTETVLDAMRGSKKLHIVDYGIYYGFQWPCFMQQLARMPNGPPRLRITGIDLPQSGFRPGKRTEETGIRLAEYAKMFNIPFEYRAIVANWEAIQIEDLNIDPKEVLVVNCLYRLKNIVDETVSLDNPRAEVLNTIRRMNPVVFVHGVLNGSFGVPFFKTRFREALSHYSTLFDMLEEVTASRTDEHRLLIEREMFGREVLNVLSCEGRMRVERPETYRQWQVRNLRAGFEQLPLKKEVVSKAMYEAKKSFHRYFFVDSENEWLLQGWKGRVIFALSAWKPNSR